MVNDAQLESILFNLGYKKDEIEGIVNYVEAVEDCKKNDLDKEVKKDCNCPDNMIGQKDPCYDRLIDRFNTIGQDGLPTGFQFRGDGMIHCLELDIMFDCRMITERLKDMLLQNNSFTRNTINNSSGIAGRVLDIITSSIHIG